MKLEMYFFIFKKKIIYFFLDPGFAVSKRDFL